MKGILTIIFTALLVFTLSFTCLGAEAWTDETRITSSQVAGVEHSSAPDPVGAAEGGSSPPSAIDERTAHNHNSQSGEHTAADNGMQSGEQTLPTDNAQGGEEKGSDLEKYLAEKIAPVAVGVATSLIALFSGFAKLKSAISGLDRSGKELDTVRDAVSSTLTALEKQIRSALYEMEEKLSAVPEIKEGYGQIRTACEGLKEQNERLLTAIKLGFESFPEAVKCGNARKIAILSQSAEDTGAEK